ncbi:PLDc N-terminal domain-containing protein [Microbacterium lacus]|uniref:PLDc N-terminal domain-containing protein n=1 Tax=Microbacterium lacus TaxID=415217 RepID=UPI00384C672F
MIWDLLWFSLWSFFFVAYLCVLIYVVIDIFRDHDLSGGLKAVWIVFLVFVPFVTSLVYVIARGKGMAERSAVRSGVVAEQDSYHPRASANPTDDIAQAAALLAAGTITQGEFDALKSKALGNQYFGA